MNQPDYRTPGQLIKNLLSERGWTHQLLASILDVDRSIISKIIKGNRAVNAELAIGLGEVFNESPERFMNLQMSFDLAQARIIVMPDPSRAVRAHLFSQLPIGEMMKRGWIDEVDIKEMSKIEDSIMQFFESESPDKIELLPHAAKKTKASELVSAIQLAWLYRVRQIAKEMLAPRFTKTKGREVIKKLKELRRHPEDTRHIPRILMESGIRYVLVESLKGAKIDGVCFWLDDYSPVIGMSVRFDRIDNFWFVLRHELEHVLQGDGKSEIVVDYDLEGGNSGVDQGLPKIEQVANAAGADFCVSQKMMEKFIKHKSPIFSDRDVVGFAKMQNVHPGLIAGQLQRHTGRHELFRKHLSPIRKHIAPSAMVDGWGDIPPVG